MRRISRISSTRSVSLPITQGIRCAALLGEWCILKESCWPDWIQDEMIIVVRNIRLAGDEHLLFLPRSTAARHIRDIEALEIEDLPLRECSHTWIEIASLTYPSWKIRIGQEGNSWARLQGYRPIGGALWISSRTSTTSFLRQCLLAWHRLCTSSSPSPYHQTSVDNEIIQIPIADRINVEVWHRSDRGASKEKG